MNKRTENKKSWELLTLKILLLVYIIMSFTIAGFNYGLDSQKNPDLHELVTKIWHLYENQFKTGLIILGSLLTLRIKGKKAVEQRKNLIGFMCAAFVIHIITPMLLSNPDIYFFAMAAPWSATALQLMSESSGFYQSYFPLWGAAGISAAIVFYLIITLITYLGTVLFGRRWQCSTVCLFNGFISESFSPAFPVFGKKKPATNRLKKFFSVMRWFLLAAAVMFFLYWVAVIIFRIDTEASAVIGSAEIYKYLLLELFTAMFFWVVFTGRGYCYYCPLGTVLGYVAKKAGQKIITDKTGCINCGKCDSACPMGIEINKLAVVGKPVVHKNCVGCRHCVDACPKNTLEYTTRFLTIT